MDYPNLTYCKGLEEGNEPPDAYFGLLPAIILSKLKEQEREFDAPNGYFEGFEAQILAKIALDCPLLNGISKQEEDLPPFYIENIYNRLRNKIQLENDLVEMPLLSSLEKTEMSVPKGYFEDFEKKLPLIQAPKAKIFAFSFVKRVANIAAILLMGMVGLYYLNLPKLTDNETNSISFQTLSDEELQKAIESENMDDHVLAKEFNTELAQIKKVKTGLNNISEDEIIEYLDAEDLDL